MYLRKRTFLELSIALMAVVLTFFVSGNHTPPAGIALAATSPATKAPATPIVQSTEDPLVVTSAPT